MLLDKYCSNPYIGTQTEQDLTKIHINCDMGESYGPYIIGNDRALMPFISACNIACGLHAGDPIHMQKTIEDALQHNVEIGAHPGYPDIPGFGRRSMHFEEHELKVLLLYQLGALEKLVIANNGTVSHVKAHGALYNAAAKDESIARIIAEVVKMALPNAYLYAPANSVQLEIARQAGLEVKIEAFIDRKYTDALQLASRKISGAVIENEELALQQLRSMVYDNQVTTIEGNKKTIEADTYCIHGDNPKALDIIKKIRTSL